MRRLFSRWIRRWADANLSRETDRLNNQVAQLKEELAAERSRVRIQERELELLAAVLARDVKRVEAETAAAAKAIADAER